MRVVETEVEAQGFQSITIAGRGAAEDGGGALITPVSEAVSLTNSYTNVLPSLNINYSATENLALRLGLSRVVTRPDYRQQAPINAITVQNNRGDNDSDFVSVLQTGANNNLRPYIADQIDITAEYYLENGGALYTSLFHKQIADFIADRVGEQSVELPFDASTQDLVEEFASSFDNGVADFSNNFTTTAEASIPINISRAEVFGVELGANLPLDGLLPINGFGVQGAYTFIESSFEDSSIQDFGFGFPGTSQNNFNAVLYYENDRFSSRLSYVFRDDFLRNVSETGALPGASIFTGSQDWVTLNFGYTPIDNLKLGLDITNLTGDDREDYFFNSPENTAGFFQRPTTLSFSAAYSF